MDRSGASESPRTIVLSQVAAEIEAMRGSRLLRVAIDGVDGAGKTSFADELADLLGEGVIRASVDSFHNPRAVRYRQGKDSPRGFFEDSFNYPKLKELLLDPLSSDPPSRYCCAYFDHRIDGEVEAHWQDPPPDGILIFDGIFAHRPELVDLWDYSVFLEVSPRVSVQRCIDRAGVRGISRDPNDPVHARYVQGQQIYLDTCRPVARCTRRINNEHIDAPTFVILQEE